MRYVSEWLNRSFACSECGRTHRVQVEEVYYGAEAPRWLAEALRRRFGAARSVAVVADGRTREAAGREVVTALRHDGLNVREVPVPDPLPDHDPVCDAQTQAHVLRESGSADLLVAVGAGVVSDLVKWAAWESGRPYVCVPTAASMNGYVSANVAPSVDGVKSLITAREPVLLAASPGVLRDAPPRLTASGLGDLVAKPVSTADWHLGRVLFDDFFCPLCAGMASRIEPVYSQNPEAVAARSAEGMEALFAALLLTGFSMSMAGTSSPASGGEHLISHALDMMAARDAAPHDLHGRQVGVATIFCAALYAEILELDSPAPELAAPPDLGFWQRLAPAIAAKAAAQREREEDAVRRLRERRSLWPDLVAELRQGLPSPAAVRDILRRGGAAYRLADIGVTRERFLQAVVHGQEIRERFTVLGLARCLGLLPGRAPDLVDRWLLG
ncbi:MAG: iron-containing alcohol dehydrogenase [Lentisphaeria bacterium]|nr:iron-containing alcohol dehydrogenase [Lentisphaeria bacterium]